MKVLHELQTNLNQNLLIKTTILGFMGSTVSFQNKFSSLNQQFLLLFGYLVPLNSVLGGTRLSSVPWPQTIDETTYDMNEPYQAIL